MNKLSDLKKENKRFLESKKGVETRMNSGGDVSQILDFYRLGIRRIQEYCK